MSRLLSFEDVSFHFVCQLLEELERIKQRPLPLRERREAFSHCFASWLKSTHVTVFNGLCPLLRLLLPELDRDRKYFIKDRMLVEYALDVVGVRGTDSEKGLREWKSDPSNPNQGKLALVLQALFHKYAICEARNMTLREVNEYLDTLQCNSFDERDYQKQLSALRHLYSVRRLSGACAGICQLVGLLTIGDEMADSRHT